MARRRGRHGRAQPALRRDRDGQGDGRGAGAVRRHDLEAPRRRRETLAVGAPLATFEVAGSVGAAVTTTRLCASSRRTSGWICPTLRFWAGWASRGRTWRGWRTRPRNRGWRAIDHRSAVADEAGDRRRLTEVAAIPQVTTFRTVDCTALEAVRADLGVSPLPLFARALAEVCREHPELNASWDGERILLFHEIRVGSPRTPNAD